MLNKDGIIRKKYGVPVQILANVEHQFSVGCRVPATLGVDVGDGMKIVKAGTPIKIDLLNTQTPVGSGGSGNNAVLLHNVDVTDVKSGGAANGTALIWGFVNLNRVEEDVKAKLKTAMSTMTNSKITFVQL